MCAIYTWSPGLGALGMYSGQIGWFVFTQPSSGSFSALKGRIQKRVSDMGSQEDSTPIPHRAMSVRARSRNANCKIPPGPTLEVYNI